MTVLTLHENNGVSVESDAFTQLRNRSKIGAYAEIILDYEWREKLKEAEDKASALTATEDDRNAHEALLRLRPLKTQRWAFRRLSARAYEALIRAHPPTAEQKAAGGQGMFAPTFNPDTFVPALVAAALVEPRLTAEQVAALWEDDEDALLSSGELVDLGSAAIQAQRRPAPIP